MVDIGELRQATDELRQATDRLRETALRLSSLWSIREQAVQERLDRAEEFIVELERAYERLQGERS